MQKVINVIRKFPPPLEKTTTQETVDASKTGLWVELILRSLPLTLPHSLALGDSLNLDALFPFLAIH